ncbi:MAG TPA: acyl-CoA dehydrogenase family protein [Phenylobacterium sp.]|uniref:acyl-CoA dehydrogenase family protein n=1 Tax=Phenylobacterium sp. TaxID=1871053 RepID=UPI002B49969C|nr:acyl-CoA dehydrogenase family protein [Phenylobacterium sp.]HKR87914.1 acyl-CoA dehydrogenase family protein [Phenylobacterium sp.]HKT54459.1 acyl-CoA dehydrogenase family protein [Caulobacteraceae bacterium]
MSDKAKKADAGCVDRTILDKVGDEAAFREAVRAWLADAMARRHELDADGAASFYDSQQWWMAERNKIGLGTPHWPKAYGGDDLSLKYQVIVAEEGAKARAPALNIFIVSLNHVPHTLMAWGSEEQKTRYLPGVANGVVWCQGFSEPNAGSDLASLRTRAERRGDHYVINGQKIWSSFSMYADYCILLARTDTEAPKHRGISYFLMDMKAPGVEVRPIRQPNGEAEFAELFLTDVKIPVEDLVGEENQGWAIAQSTLAAERGVLAFENGERLRYIMEDFYASAVAREAKWLREPHLHREYVRLFGEMQACRRMLRRLLRENETGSPAAASTVVHVKVINTTLWRKVSDFMLKTQGLSGRFFHEPALGLARDPIDYYITSFGGTIAGGSNEIMRNIISERVLGMPRA